MTQLTQHAIRFPVPLLQDGSLAKALRAWIKTKSLPCACIRPPNKGRGRPRVVSTAVVDGHELVWHAFSTVVSAPCHTHWRYISLDNPSLPEPFNLSLWSSFLRDLPAFEGTRFTTYRQTFELELAANGFQLPHTNETVSCPGVAPFRTSGIVCRWGVDTSSRVSTPTSRKRAAPDLIGRTVTSRLMNSTSRVGKIIRLIGSNAVVRYGFESERIVPVVSLGMGEASYGRFEVSPPSPRPHPASPLPPTTHPPRNTPSLLHSIPTRLPCRRRQDVPHYPPVEVACRSRMDVPMFSSSDATIARPSVSALFASLACARIVLQDSVQHTTHHVRAQHH